MRKILFLSLLFFSFFNCEKKTQHIGLIADNAMVVSAKKEASAIGLSILKKGGNAFDAMIATQFALAVSYPFAGNIGGGGFMVYRKFDGEKGSLDFREKAPLAATKDMYLDSLGNVIPNLSSFGSLSIGVPGTIAGVFEVYKKFGTLPFSELIQPSIDLARNGIYISENQAESFNKHTNEFSKANSYKTIFENHWKANDLLKQEELAKTLERIRDFGKNEFYKGKTAKLLVNYLTEMGGIITLEDLEKYQAIWRKPIEFTYKKHNIISMNLPSSGGICLAQILKSIEPYNLDAIKHNSVKYIQLLVEAEKRAYADRANYLGDIDFVAVPIDSLINKAYLNQRMSSFSWKKATPSSTISHGKIIGFESTETTHFSIIDQFGNAVSVTTTLNGAYGSKVVVKGAGFILNNEMDDFSIKPGIPNMFGLVGSKANAIAAEKRMLSSMTPTIVEENNQLKMVIGTPVGSTIITTVLQNILNVLDYDMGMQQSVNKARFHHQWLPDSINLEPNGFEKIDKEHLKKLGYQIIEKNSIILGKVDAILVLKNGKLEGGADPRGDDTAVGF